MNRMEQNLTRVLESMLAIALFAIVTIVVTLVVMRYVFNSSITGANEVITILFVYTTAIGSAVAVGRGEHISISFAVDRLPPRIRRYSDTLVLLLIAVLNGTMVIYSLGWIEVTGDYLMPTTGWPRMLAQACVPLGCGLAVFYCLAKLTTGCGNPTQSTDGPESQ